MEELLIRFEPTHPPSTTARLLRTAFFALLILPAWYLVGLFEWLGEALLLAIWAVALGVVLVIQVLYTRYLSAVVFDPARKLLTLHFLQTGLLQEAKASSLPLVLEDQELHYLFIKPWRKQAYPRLWLRSRQTTYFLEEGAPGREGLHREDLQRLAHELAPFVKKVKIEEAPAPREESSKETKSTSEKPI